MFAQLFQTLDHLPVTSIASTVAEHFAAQMIPIVTSQVASGKTMLIPAHCAELLKDDPIDPVVYVLEPTRFLANNAAESLRGLLGPNNENLIGCINSNRSDDDSILHPNNRIVFTTVGYALSSGILATRNNFILDEAHETSIDLSLTKAYLHHRLKRGDLINVAVMSATIDIDNEVEYWGENAFHFTTHGSAYPVEFHHRPAQGLPHATLEMIVDHNRSGILVFVAGVEEIENAIDGITTLLAVNDIDFEIYGIHGNSTGQQRKIASAPRQKPVKILVGTNVLESGVSLPWVNAGISSGDTKIMHVKGNVRRLNKEELPRWRIDQQMGRVGRFEPGVFILAHASPKDFRPQMAAPDIVRLPLTEFVMHCTNFPDIHIHDLEFTKREQPKIEDIEQAITVLKDYGLIEETEGRVVLTDEGRLIQPLPLSYRAAAAVCEAHQMGKLAEMLPLIVMLDMGDIRHIHREPMRGASWTTSDPIQQTMTLAQHFVFNQHDMTHHEMRETAEFVNVNLKKYNEFMLLLKDLERKTQCRAKWSCYLHNGSMEEREAFDRLCKQVIFRAMVVETYSYSTIFQEVKIPTVEHGGFTFSSAKVSSTTTCELDYSSFIVMCAGSVRVVTPKRGMPFTILESVTAFTKSDVRHLVQRFGKPVFQKIADMARVPVQIDDLLSSPKVQQRETDRALYLGTAYRDDYVEEPVVQEVEEAPKLGTLGSLLTAALNKN